MKAKMQSKQYKEVETVPFFKTKSNHMINICPIKERNIASVNSVIYTVFFIQNFLLNSTEKQFVFCLLQSFKKFKQIKN